jgi:hypothetical protein
VNAATGLSKEVALLSERFAEAKNVPISNYIVSFEFGIRHIQEASSTPEVVFGQVNVSFHVAASCTALLAGEPYAVHGYQDSTPQRVTRDFSTIR